MATRTEGDAAGRWVEAARQLEAAAPLSRGRRAAARVLLGVWAALILTMVVALAVPLFGMTGPVSRSGWQVLGAVGLLLLGAVGLLLGVRGRTSATIGQVAPTASERREVRRALAVRHPAAASRRAVLDAIAAEERTVMLLVLAAVGTYLLGYLDGVAANDWSAQATVGLPLLVAVFVLIAVLPAIRAVRAWRFLRAAPGR